MHPSYKERVLTCLHLPGQATRCTANPFSPGPPAWPSSTGRCPAVTSRDGAALAPGAKARLPPQTHGRSPRGWWHSARRAWTSSTHLAVTGHRPLGSAGVNSPSILSPPSKQRQAGTRAGLTPTFHLRHSARRPQGRPISPSPSAPTTGADSCGMVTLSLRPCPARAQGGRHGGVQALARRRHPSLLDPRRPLLTTDPLLNALWGGAPDGGSVGASATPSDTPPMRRMMPFPGFQRHHRRARACANFH